MLLWKWLIADGVEILSERFHTALCNIWLVGKGTVQKRTVGNRSRCKKIPQCKHCKSSMRGICLNLKTIGLWTIQSVELRDDVDGLRTDQEKRRVV